VSSKPPTAHIPPGSVPEIRGEPAAPGSGPGAPATGAAAFGPDLLARVRAREPEALAAFFERTFDQVFGLVYRLLGDRSLAEDVTQEVFLKVHRAIHRLDIHRDPAPWLTTIACNACRDVWRSGPYRMGRRSDALDDPAVAGRLASPDPGPEGGMLAAERERRVRAALARLPEPLRLAVLLHDYRGVSHEQAARLQGIHPAAARKRYSRALAALGALLRQDFE